MPTDRAQDEQPMPTSSRACKTCAKVQPWTKWDGRDGVVSPSGVVHIGMEDGDTACGKDATGEHWWWPL